MSDFTQSRPLHGVVSLERWPLRLHAVRARWPISLEREERENSLLTTNLSGSTSSCLRCFWWTGLAPWEFEFPFPCSLISSCHRHTYTHRPDRVISSVSTRDQQYTERHEPPLLTPTPTTHTLYPTTSLCRPALPHSRVHRQARVSVSTRHHNTHLVRQKGRSLN